MKLCTVNRVQLERICDRCSAPNCTYNYPLGDIIIWYNTTYRFQLQIHCLTRSLLPSPYKCRHSLIRIPSLYNECQRICLKNHTNLLVTATLQWEFIWAKNRPRRMRKLRNTIITIVMRKLVTLRLPCTRLQNCTMVYTHAHDKTRIWWKSLLALKMKNQLEIPMNSTTWDFVRHSENSPIIG